MDWEPFDVPAMEQYDKEIKKMNNMIAWQKETLDITETIMDKCFKNKVYTKPFNWWEKRIIANAAKLYTETTQIVAQTILKNMGH